MRKKLFPSIRFVVSSFCKVVVLYFVHATVVNHGRVPSTTNMPLVIKDAHGIKNNHDGSKSAEAIENNPA